jgi:hypothetical protein
VKRIQTNIATKETLELKKAVASELQDNNKDQEKAIATLLLESDQKEDQGENSKGIQRTTDSGNN